MAVAYLCVMAAAAAAMLLRVAAARRACARRRLLTMLHGLRAGAVGRFGVSLLLTEGVTLRRIEELLAVEYTLYEVVALLDGERDEELFAALVARYRLIRVEYHPTGELPAEGIRALYRSRKRCFRRLVLVDFDAAAPSRTPFPACDAAAEVASYDYLLPLRPRERLTAGAVERIAVGLAAVRPTPALLRSLAGCRATVYSRAAVVAAGGFRRGMSRRIAPHRTIADPLTVADGCRGSRRGRRLLRAAGFAAAGGLGLAAAPDALAATAWGVTLSLLALGCIRVRQLHRRCG